MKDLFTPPLNFGLDETLDMLREQVNNFACEAIAPLSHHKQIKTISFPISSGRSWVKWACSA